MWFEECSCNCKKEYPNTSTKYGLVYIEVIVAKSYRCFPSCKKIQLAFVTGIFSKKLLYVLILVWKVISISMSGKALIHSRLNKLVSPAVTPGIYKRFFYPWYENSYFLKSKACIIEFYICQVIIMNGLLIVFVTFNYYKLVRYRYSLEIHSKFRHT